MKYIIGLILLIASIKGYSQTGGYDKIIAYYAKEKQFNGSVLVAKEGKIVYSKGIGLANRQNLSTISAESKFKIASVTKTFTAVLILQLYEQGKLDLQATIDTYLPEYQGQGKDKVSIHHLLTYSSGIANSEGGKGLEVYQKPMELDNFITSYCSGGLEVEPGKQFRYNNGDYILLGRIIEKITGKSFKTVLKERILIPSGMDNTGIIVDDQIVPGLVASYYLPKEASHLQNDPPYYIQNYFASGAMYSTAEDLYRFDQALFEGKLLKPEMLALMLTPYPQLYNVAYGFWVSDVPLGKVLTKVADRQGAIMGSNSTWAHLPDKNITVIILSNTNGTNINEMREKLLLHSLRQEIVLP